MWGCGLRAQAKPGLGQAATRALALSQPLALDNPGAPCCPRSIGFGCVFKGRAHMCDVAAEAGLALGPKSLRSIPQLA